MIDRGRNMMLVGAGAAEERSRARGCRPRRHARQRALDLELALRVRKIEDAAADHGFLRHVAKQRVDIARADLRQHCAAVIGG